MTTLYQDEKFALNLVAEDVCKLEFVVNENVYQLTSRFLEDNESCICINSLDGAVDIVMPKAIHIAFVISNLMSGKQIQGWKYGLLTTRQFCEMIESRILRDKAEKKQHIVAETGYKTAINMQQKGVKNEQT